jgi:glutamine synthetase
LIIEIEANTLNEMVNASVVPASLEYAKLLEDNLSQILYFAKTAKVKFDKKAVEDQKEHLAEVISKIYYVRRNTKELVKLLEKAGKLDSERKGELYFNELKPLMEHIRRHVDDLERVISDEHWDLPKYREMLFLK